MFVGPTTCPNTPAEPSRAYRKPLYLAIIAAIIFAVALSAALPDLRVSSARNVKVRSRFERAGLGESVIVRTNRRSDLISNLSLKHGRVLLSSYEGPVHLQRALAQNETQPRALAAADFDEDGVPDLVSGYDYAGRGILTVHRGNVDSIYPNSPEAIVRRANGGFTDAPFLSPALVVELDVPADFVGAGDFDADSHWDIVVVNSGGSS
ncbi:MAG: hypothetical protein ABR568_09625, partial [Pyrinomonadaceae bacterium]